MTNNNDKSKSTKTIIYAIPGLGLDGRIFDNLEIDGYEVKSLSYIDPELDENLDSYIDRILVQIPETEEKIYLMGHSFGGIIAQEISHKRATKAVIILSSIMTAAELPPHLSIMRKVPAYDLVKKEIIRRTYFIWGEQDGYNNYEERKIFMEMTDKLSDYYYKWAIGQVVNWKPSSPIEVPFFRIHGSRDMTFLKRYLTPPLTIIKGGTHVVVKSQAKLVSAHIGLFLFNINNTQA